VQICLLDHHVGASKHRVGRVSSEVTAVVALITLDGIDLRREIWRYTR
jgi:hypothetical protein